MPFPSTYDDRIKTIITNCGRGLQGGQITFIRNEVLQQTQHRFARFVGAAPSAVAQWERGETTPSPIRRKALWLLACSQVNANSGHPHSIWTLLEHACATDRYYGTRPKSTPPRINRGAWIWRSGEYLPSLHYQNPMQHHTYAWIAHALGLSQIQLSRLIGAAQPTVNRWDSGRTRTSEHRPAIRGTTSLPLKATTEFPMPKGTSAKMLWLLGASPILYEERIPIEAAFEWMEIVDRQTSSGDPYRETQLHWFAHYDEEPLDYPDKWPTRTSEARIRNKERYTLDSST